jgi:hypothetical protein
MHACKFYARASYERGICAGRALLYTVDLLLTPSVLAPSVLTPFVAGLIDILQEWNFSKKLERFFKTWMRGQDADGEKQ